MAKAQNKTVETNDSADDFLKNVKEEQKRKDCLAIVDLLSKHTKMKAKMWGPAIVGFGSYHYKYESGREGDAPLVAFSPRASSITIYLSGIKEELIKKIGKYKLSGGCLHIKKLEDIDTAVLLKMIDNSVKYTRAKYPE